MLVDSFHRQHDYLRISLTDNCNFRCTYCMPNEDIVCMPNTRLMQVEEIYEIAKVFIGMGVNKIRLTGGEPLLRKEFDLILEKLSKLPTEITITTNGALAHKHINSFNKAGIRSINVSIDSLQNSKFKILTKRDSLDQVWKNILLLISEQFSVKLNVVVMKGINDDEVNAFVALTKELPLHVRFIEFMPFDGNGWKKEKVVRAKEMLQQIDQEYDYIKLQDLRHDTAKKYKLISSKGSFAFITTMSQVFCQECNRLRLTADGKIKNCLFGKDELDLLSAYRQGKDIRELISLSVQSKHEKLGGQFSEDIMETEADSIVNRSMINIGG